VDFTTGAGCPKRGELDTVLSDGDDTASTIKNAITTAPTAAAMYGATRLFRDTTSVLTLSPHQVSARTLDQ
jgi:hypothetical protein